MGLDFEETWKLLVTMQMTLGYQQLIVTWWPNWVEIDGKSENRFSRRTSLLDLANKKIMTATMWLFLVLMYLQATKHSRCDVCERWLLELAFDGSPLVWVFSLAALADGRFVSPIKRAEVLTLSSTVIALRPSKTRISMMDAISKDAGVCIPSLCVLDSRGTNSQQILEEAATKNGGRITVLT